jgi:vacuolar-type H+-ATPase subunit I/STV1
MISNSYNLSVRIPFDIADGLDKLGKDKTNFIKEALSYALKNRKDNITILQEELENVEKKKQELIDKLEKERKTRQEFIERNKEKSENLYSKIYKKLRDVFIVKGGFIESDEISFDINEYCRLTGKDKVQFRKDIKEAILKENG